MNEKSIQEKDDIQVDVIVFKDEKYFTAYIPALNLTSHSTVEATAIEGLNDGVKLFFDYWIRKDKLNEKLTGLGWKEVEQGDKKRMIPYPENITIPYLFLGHDFSKTTFNIPVYFYDKSHKNYQNTSVFNSIGFRVWGDRG